MKRFFYYELYLYNLQHKIRQVQIGSTQKPLEDRLKFHNSALYGKKAFTSTVDDWKLVLIFECENYQHALNFEKKIKSMKSKIYIHNLLNYNELREKIYNQTRVT